MISFIQLEKWNQHDSEFVGGDECFQYAFYNDSKVVMQWGGAKGVRGRRRRALTTVGNLLRVGEDQW